MITSLLVISETLGLFGNTMTADHMYFRHRWEKFPKQVQTQLSQKQKTFSGNFIAFLKSGENFRHFEKKDHLHSINISEFIEPRKCSYLNARKLLFWNTFPESTCSRITNIAETYTAALLSKFLINLKENDLENMSLSHIKNVTTVWFHVDCGSHVFSSYMKEVPGTGSNAIISKTKNIFLKFYCMFAICTKFCAFWKQRSAS